MAEKFEVAKLAAGWEPPSELRRSCPREVALTRGGVAVMVLCALLVLGGVTLASVLSVRAAHEAADARLLRDEGVDIRAEVTRLWRSGEDSDRYRVAYRFTAGDLTIEGKASVSRGTWNSLDVGAPLVVRYAPSKPTVNRPKAGGASPMPRWLPLVVGGSLLLSAVLLPLKVHRQKTLLADGRPAPAVVTRYRRVHVHDGAGERLVYYEFLLPDGATRKGRSSCSRGRPEVGGVMCVLYDPDNPRRNTPYPMKLVRLADH